MISRPVLRFPRPTRAPQRFTLDADAGRFESSGAYSRGHAEFLCARFSEDAAQGPPGDTRATAPSIRDKIRHRHLCADRQAAEALAMWPNPRQLLHTGDAARSVSPIPAPAIGLLLRNHCCSRSRSRPSMTPMPVHFAVANESAISVRRRGRRVHVRDVFDVRTCRPRTTTSSKSAGLHYEDVGSFRWPFTAHGGLLSGAAAHLHGRTDPCISRTISCHQYHLLRRRVRGLCPRHCGRPASAHTSFVQPPETSRSPSRRRHRAAQKDAQMPTYHLKRRRNGITLVNHRVGRRTRKTATDHIRFPRPLPGHPPCGAARNSQRWAFRAAHAYLRARTSAGRRSAGLGAGCRRCQIRARCKTFRPT